MKNINGFIKENLKEIAFCKHLKVKVILWNEKLYFIAKLNKEDVLQIANSYKKEPLIITTKYNKNILNIYFIDIFLDFNKISLDLEFIDYSFYLLKQEDLQIIFFDENCNYLFSKKVKIKNKNITNSLF